MRKQTTEERLREFEKWQEAGAPEGKIVIGYSDNVWWDFPKVCIKWNEPDTVYLFNDEYIDLKKAWYEGKAIEINLGDDTWHEFERDFKPTWEAPASNYRIRPPEVTDAEV